MFVNLVDKYLKICYHNNVKDNKNKVKLSFAVVRLDPQGQAGKE